MRLHTGSSTNMRNHYEENDVSDVLGVNRIRRNIADNSSSEVYDHEAIGGVSGITTLKRRSDWNFAVTCKTK
ncbi:hypothetical protein O9993_01310 [Vibrio lentus]|nr:hypothetical protein [Vibrio lentus]